eukprot:357880-Prorocentrum_minimum.AAC.2
MPCELPWWRRPNGGYFVCDHLSAGTGGNREFAIVPIVEHICVVHCIDCIDWQGERTCRTAAIVFRAGRLQPGGGVFHPTTPSGEFMAKADVHTAQPMEESKQQGIPIVPIVTDSRDFDTSEVRSDSYKCEVKETANCWGDSQ